MSIEAAQSVGDAVLVPSTWRWVARLVLTTLAWLCVVVAAIGLTVRHLGSGHQTVILLSAAAWVLTLSVVPAALLFAVTRHWWSMLAVAAVVIAQVVTYTPLFVSSDTPSGVTLRVMTQNLRLGDADAQEVVEHVRASHVDILIVQELTSDELVRLRSAGIDDEFEGSVTYPDSGSTGNGIWTRFPLRNIGRIASPGGVMATARMHDGRSLMIIGVHLAAPSPQNSERWLNTLAQTVVLLRFADPGPAIVAGDFNSTVDHARLRGILRGGWADAADQAGAGIVRTWPANRAVPPLLGLDHVLTRDAVASSVSTVRTAGSDHLGLLATVVVRTS